MCLPKHVPISKKYIYISSENSTKICFYMQSCSCFIYLIYKWRSNSRSAKYCISAVLLRCSNTKTYVTHIPSPKRNVEKANLWILKEIYLLFRFVSSPPVSYFYFFWVLIANERADALIEIILFPYKIHSFARYFLICF